jgi:hypothetical protein
MSRCLLVALIVTLPALPGYPQSLGDAAAREKEKRAKRAPASTRVFTGADLKSAPKPEQETRSEGESRADAAEGSSSGEGGGSSNSEAEGAGSASDRGESAWRQRVQERRDAIAVAERSIQSSQERLARLMADREPVALSDPNRLQTIENLKSETRQALETAQRELADAQQALRDLEEEARRNNVPPGWLR